MRILLTGRNGQVGWALAHALQDVVATDRQSLDLALSAQIVRAVREVKPDVILNAAAYTAVDKAESEPEVARRVNETGPANLARAAASCGSRLFHISTDFVFDGESSQPYRPGDATRPLSVYGVTKLAGENAVRQSVTPISSAIPLSRFLNTSRRIGS